MKSSKHLGATLLVVVATAVAVAGCGGSDGSGSSASSGTSAKPKGEIVITCSSCPPKPPKNDAFKQYYKDMVDRFNAKFAGRYRIDDTKYYNKVNDADGAQHYLRAAATDTLPDLFTDQASVLRAVARTGRLMDFAPVLKQDATWKNSFQGDAYLTLTDSKGHIWGVPEQRDVVGMFYNKALFEKAGIAQFPATWDQVLQDCSRLKAAGVIPIAMDGDWTTQLVWSHLIGTSPGGKEFLAAGIKEGNLAQNPAVVKATEFLKRLHTSGCTNKDAFTGDYNHAAAPFLDKQAAMIANGSWMIPDNKQAKLDQGYTIAPGSGVVVLPGSAGWASGAKDEAHREAVIAFMKFLTSDDEMVRKAVATGSYWPTKPKLTSAQTKQLEPLSYQVIKQADQVANVYLGTKIYTPQEFTRTFVNNLPAYVQGRMSTVDFLNALSDTITRQR